ncbi:MAG: hypothetical protein WCF04_09225, partial [Candidatus Nanopelagicales bacterium]
GALHYAIQDNAQGVLDAACGPDWPVAVTALTEALPTLPGGATSARPEQHGLQWGAVWRFAAVEGQVLNRLRTLLMPGHELLSLHKGMTVHDVLWENYVSDPAWSQLPAADLLVARWRKGSRPRLRPVLDPLGEAARLAELASKADAKPARKHRAQGF